MLKYFSFMVQQSFYKGGPGQLFLFEKGGGGSGQSQIFSFEKHEKGEDYGNVKY
jgi:hypothetical protein